MACPVPDAKACAGLLGRRIHNHSVELRSILGHGSFGVVYHAVAVASGREYAVKCMMRPVLASHTVYQTRELTLHRRVRHHPGVVTVHGVVREADFIFVFMDYCPGGDLFSGIVDRDAYIGNDALIKNVFIQLLDATHYCHQMGVFHRDLKPENILLRNGGTQLLIADFGLSTGDMWSKEFGCGSLAYMSPENHSTSPYKAFGHYSTQANDVWSLGVILINLVSGHSPWDAAVPEDSKFRRYLMNSRCLRELFPASDALLRILKSIFTMNPSHRITIPELREAIVNIESLTTPVDEDSWGETPAYTTGGMRSLHPHSIPASISPALLPPSPELRESSPRDVRAVFIPPPKDFWGSRGGFDMGEFLAHSDSDSSEPSTSGPGAEPRAASDALPTYNREPLPRTSSSFASLSSFPPLPPLSPSPAAPSYSSYVHVPRPSAPTPSSRFLAPPQNIFHHSRASGSSSHSDTSSASSRSLPRTPEMFAADDAAGAVFVEALDTLALGHRHSALGRSVGVGAGVDVLPEDKIPEGVFRHIPRMVPVQVS